MKISRTKTTRTTTIKAHHSNSSAALPTEPTTKVFRIGRTSRPPTLKVRTMAMHPTLSSKSRLRSSSKTKCRDKSKTSKWCNPTSFREPMEVTRTQVQCKTRFLIKTRCTLTTFTQDLAKVRMVHLLESEISRISQWVASSCRDRVEDNRTWSQTVEAKPNTLKEDKRTVLDLKLWTLSHRLSITMATWSGWTTTQILPSTLSCNLTAVGIRALQQMEFKVLQSENLARSVTVLNVMLRLFLAVTTSLVWTVPRDAIVVRFVEHRSRIL